MKHLMPLLLLGMLSTATPRAGALDTEPLTPGARLAAGCAACHGPGGASVGGTPTLAGMTREALLQALQAFAAGQREATVMHRHARGYSATELEALADYFASRQRPLTFPRESLP